MDKEYLSIAAGCLGSAIIIALVAGGTVGLFVLAFRTVAGF